ncbi:SurA N-terminal domain-containing protein [Sporosarcina siberiensis]|uniref:peptidylprolyl isomerase n=1 Tax=Sporosarcina siberiensis TaxID=1365606 RepID=A0ABW4SGA8_9BACL
MKIKKILFPFIVGALAFSLAACGDDDKAKKEETPKGEVQEEAKEEVSEDANAEQESAEEMQAKLEEQQLDAKKLVAVVNDEELTGEEYNVALASIQSQMMQTGQDLTSKESIEQIKEQTIDTLVNQALILQSAKKEDIKASKAEIDEKYVTFEEQFGGKKELEQALKDQKVDEKTFENQIIDSIIFAKYLEKMIPTEKVSDEEIQNYYDQAVADAKEAEQEVPPFEEASEQIAGILSQQEQQKNLAAHVEELKENAKIELKI